MIHPSDVDPVHSNYPVAHFELIAAIRGTAWDQFTWNLKFFLRNDYYDSPIPLLPIVAP